MVKENLIKIDQEDKESIASSGFEFEESKRMATFFQQDDEPFLFHSLLEGVDILPMGELLNRFPQFYKLKGEAFKMLKKTLPEDINKGYFIRVKKNTVLELPIQACLFLKKANFKQKVHNLVVVEEGAKVYLITGCTASKSANEGFHLGISEFFIERGAYLNFTMIHSWKEDITVRPLSVALLEEGAHFVSNYVCLRPVKDIVMSPVAILKGEDAKASFNSLILGYKFSNQDIGSKAILRANKTQVEIVSRVVSLGGCITSRGYIKAEAKYVKGHLECRGLIINEKGRIYAVPELETEFRDVDLTHEAAIGKISKEEVEYLCARGMSFQEAQSIIVRGFMDVNILGLPSLLQQEIKNLEDKILNKGL